MAEGPGSQRRRDLPVARVRRTLAALLAAALASSAGAAVAAQERDDQPPPRPAIQSLKGDKYRMASTKMADRVTRYVDPAGDQVDEDGSSVSDAPGWTDLRAVYVAGTRMPAKLLTKMTSDYPQGTAGAFHGEEMDLRRKDRIVFVAVEMARKLPAASGGQQVEVGFGGNAATPVQVGTALDTRAGVEAFTLSGLFSNGGYGTGRTDVSDKPPGVELADDDYYNTEGGAFGFYGPKRATWFLVAPRAGDTDSITVSVRSTTPQGQVIDRLELPGGGHFIDLRDPTGGYKPKAGSPLRCRSLETFSGDGGVLELSDVEATLIRYTAGVAADASAQRIESALGPAIAALGPVSVTLSPVGSEAEPLIVEGQLALTPGGNAVSLTFEAPAGQWTFALADEPGLVTTAGQLIVDHRSLTGTAGVLTGPGLDGFVAGDLSCAEPEAAAAAGEAPAAAETSPAEEPAGDDASEDAQDAPGSSG